MRLMTVRWLSMCGGGQGWEVEVLVSWIVMVMLAKWLAFVSHPFPIAIYDCELFLFSPVRAERTSCKSLSWAICFNSPQDNLVVLSSDCRVSSILIHVRTGLLLFPGGFQSNACCGMIVHPCEGCVESKSTFSSGWCRWWFAAWFSIRPPGCKFALVWSGLMCRICLKQVMMKTCSLLSRHLVHLQVSTPYSSTDLTFVLNTHKRGMKTGSCSGFRASKAWHVLMIQAFTSSCVSLGKVLHCCTIEQINEMLFSPIKLVKWLCKDISIFPWTGLLVLTFRSSYQTADVWWCTGSSSHSSKLHPWRL